VFLQLLTLILLLPQKDQGHALEGRQTENQSLDVLLNVQQTPKTTKMKIRTKKMTPKRRTRRKTSRARESRRGGKKLFDVRFQCRVKEFDIFVKGLAIMAERQRLP